MKSEEKDFMFDKMGKALSDYRTKHDLSQFEFASIIGIDERNYREWEKGNGITWILKAIRLEILLGGSLSNFFGDIVDLEK